MRDGGLQPASAKICLRRCDHSAGDGSWAACDYGRLGSRQPTVCTLSFVLLSP